MRATANWPVIVAIVDGHHVNAGTREGQAPVLVDPYCPMAVETATQAVQAPSGQFHVGRLQCSIEQTRLQAQAFGMGRLDAGLAPGAEEPFQSLVPKRTDNTGICIAWLYGLAIGRKAYRARALDAPRPRLFGFRRGRLHRRRAAPDRSRGSFNGMEF